MKKRILLVVVLIFTICMFSQTVCAAYSGYDAKVHSNQFALSHDPYYKNYIGTGNDCANYVSQSVSVGGLPQDTTWRYTRNASTLDDFRYLYIDTAAWSNANEFKNYLANKIRNGSHIATKIGSWSKDGSAAPYVTYGYVDNSNNLGGSGTEVVFYDWERDGIMNHTSLCVSNNSQSTYSGEPPGDLINQHTVARYHVLWHGDSRNRDRADTRIYAFRIDY